MEYLGEAPIKIKDRNVILTDVLFKNKKIWGKIMKYFKSLSVSFGVLYAFFNCGIVNATSVSNPQQDQKLAQKIFETIENKGQNELCKEGGLLRGAALKDGTIKPVLGTAGANCDRSPVFAQIALAACSNVAGFEKSTCGVKARRVLGGMLIPKIVEDIKKSIIAGNPVLKTVVCQPFKEKLTGGLAQAESACTTAPARPTSGVPKQTVKATLKDNLDWVDALEAEIAALDSVKPAGRRKITVGGKAITLPVIDPKNKSALLAEIKKVKANLRKADQSVTSGPAVVPSDKAEEVKPFYQSLEEAKNDQELLNMLDDEEKALLGF